MEKADSGAELGVAVVVSDGDTDYDIGNNSDDFLNALLMKHTENGQKTTTAVIEKVGIFYLYHFIFKLTDL